MEKITISIKGMHCASCAGNVEKSLRKVKGVKEAKVSLMTEKAFVESEGATREDLAKAVARAGYRASEIK